MKRQKSNAILIVPVLVSAGAIAGIIKGAASNSQGLLISGCAVLLLAVIWIVVYGITEMRKP